MIIDYLKYNARGKRRFSKFLEIFQKKFSVVNILTSAYYSRDRVIKEK